MSCWVQIDHEAAEWVQVYRPQKNFESKTGVTYVSSARFEKRPEKDGFLCIATLERLHLCIYHLLVYQH